MRQNYFLRHVSRAAAIGAIILAGSAVSGVAGADPPEAPTAPTGATAAYTNGQTDVAVSWTLPSAGNPPSYAYVVTSSPGGLTCSTNGALSCAVINLVPGTTYTFSVVASNSAGKSSASKPTSGVLITQVPGGVTNLSTTYTPGTTTLTATWAAPTTGYPAPTSYSVTEWPSGATVYTTNLSYTYSNLTPGTVVHVDVAAVNTVGPGITESTTPVTIGGPPGAPGNVSASYISGSSGITISWSAPSTGFPAPSQYKVTSSPDGLTCSTAGTSCSITGVHAGSTYTFSVVATNTYGSGPAGVSNSIVAKNPPSTPGQVTFPGLRANQTSVSLSWAASSTCGSGCSYNVWANGTQIATVSVNHVVVSKLVNGQSYKFSVSATTGDGTSALSAASAAATVWFDKLHAGGSLSSGAYLWSPSHRAKLSITNGHLVITIGSRVLWRARGGTGTELLFGANGNARFVNGGATAWSSRTSEANGVLEVGNSGDLLVYRGGVLVWRSNGGKVVHHAPAPPKKHGGGTPTTTRPPVTTTTVSGVPIP
jgi:hypothetical protein